MLGMYQQFCNNDDSVDSADHQDTVTPSAQNESEMTACLGGQEKPTTSNADQELKSGLISEQETSPVALQSTWKACQSAINIVENMQESDSNRHYIPAPSPHVLQTLQAICDPGFISFIRSLLTHFNSAGRSENLYTESYQQANSQGSFLMDLIGPTDQSSESTYTHNSLYEQGELGQSIIELSSPIEASTPARVSYRTGLLAADTSQQSAQSQTPRKQGTSAARHQLDVVPKQAIRRSPRKHRAPDPTDMVKLMDHSDILIDRSLKRKACSAAKAKAGKEGFVLLYRLCSGLFSLEEMAGCRGLGIGKAKKDPNRPPLDQAKVKLLKDYVVAWCKNESKRVPTEAEMNAAITERLGYARKQILKLKE